MKKTFLTFAALTALIAATLTLPSCSKKSELIPLNLQPIVYQNENITFTVDPKLELLMIAMRLAEWEPFSIDAYSDNYNQYNTAIDKFFEKQKDHPFVKELKSRNTKKNHDNYTNILSITNYISDDLTTINIKKKELPPELKIFWKDLNPQAFIAQFNDFAVTSNYDKIWMLYMQQLKNQAVNVKEFYTFNQRTTNWVSSYFFDTAKQPEYIFSATTMSGAYNFTLSPVDNKGKLLLKSLQAAYFTKDSDWNACDSAFSIAYGYIFSTLQNHWELLSNDAERITKAIYEENQITEKINEADIKMFFARILTYCSLFDYEYYKDDEDNCTVLYNALGSQFLIPDPDKYIAITEYYQEHRDQYPSFETFVEDYLPQIIKEL